MVLLCADRQKQAMNEAGAVANTTAWCYGIFNFPGYWPIYNYMAGAGPGLGRFLVPMWRVYCEKAG